MNIFTKREILILNRFIDVLDRTFYRKDDRGLTGTESQLEYSNYNEITISKICNGFIKIVNFGCKILPFLKQKLLPDHF